MSNHGVALKRDFGQRVLLERFNVSVSKWEFPDAAQKVEMINVSDRNAREFVGVLLCPRVFVSTRRSSLVACLVGFAQLERKLVSTLVLRDHKFEHVHGDQ